MAQSGGTALLRTVSLTGADALAVDERSDRVFVTRSEGDSGSVSVLDAHSGAVLRTVLVGTFPGTGIIDAVRGRVYISSTTQVSVLDARSGAILQTLPNFGFVAVAEQAGHVFFCSTGSTHSPSIVRMLDARTNKVVRTVRVGVGANQMIVAERTRQVFVVNATDNSVSVLDAQSGIVMRTVRVGEAPNAIAVDEQTERIFVVNYRGSTVSMIDARSGRLVHTTTINLNPITLGVDEQTGHVFVPTQYSIDVLDAHSGNLVHSVNVDTPPASVPVVIDQRGRIAELLTSPLNASGQDTTGPGRLLVLDGHTASILRRITVGDVKTFGLYDVVAADLRTNRLFVLDGSGVRVFDTTRL